MQLRFRLIQITKGMMKFQHRSETSLGPSRINESRIEGGSTTALRVAIMDARFFRSQAKRSLSHSLFALVHDPERIVHRPRQFAHKRFELAVVVPGNIADFDD